MHAGDRRGPPPERQDRRDLQRSAPEEAQLERQPRAHAPRHTVGFRGRMTRPALKPSVGTQAGPNPPHPYRSQPLRRSSPGCRSRRGWGLRNREGEAPEGPAVRRITSFSDSARSIILVAVDSPDLASKDLGVRTAGGWVSTDRLVVDSKGRGVVGRRDPLPQFSSWRSGPARRRGGTSLSLDLPPPENGALSIRSSCPAHILICEPNRGCRSPWRGGSCDHRSTVGRSPYCSAPLAGRGDLTPDQAAAVAVGEPPGAVVRVDGGAADPEMWRCGSLRVRSQTPNPVHGMCIKRAPGGVTGRPGK